MTVTNRFAFVASQTGSWRVTSVATVTGEGLPSPVSLDVVPAAELEAARSDPTKRETTWMLEGLVSNVRYATRAELTALRSQQEPLGRASARCAALIPIRKSAAWWALAQDERREIFEETSHHTAIGMDYMPAIARQLFHCRDINQPFDFLTWFEFAPQDAEAFEHLVSRLRATTEWTYVEREVDVRLSR